MLCQLLEPPQTLFDEQILERRAQRRIACVLRVVLVALTEPEAGRFRRRGRSARRWGRRSFRFAARSTTALAQESLDGVPDDVRIDERALVVPAQFTARLLRFLVDGGLLFLVLETIEHVLREGHSGCSWFHRLLSCHRLVPFLEPSG